MAMAAPAATTTQSETTARYVRQLQTLPLTQVRALPSELASRRAQLDSELAALAQARYGALLAAHQASSVSHARLAQMHEALQALLCDSLALDARARHFAQRTVGSQSRHRDLLGQVLRRSDILDDLLEAPSTVDACVRAGHWQEALDVANRLADIQRRLETRAAGQGAIALVTRVRQDVAGALLALRARALDSLRQRQLKLPGAVRTLAILRRINDDDALALATAVAALDGQVNGDSTLASRFGSDKVQTGAAPPPQQRLGEPALRVIFLAARWHCLRGELDSIEGQLAASGVSFSLHPPSSSSSSSSDASFLHPLSGSSLTTTTNDNNTSSNNNGGNFLTTALSAEESDERTRATRRWVELWREMVGDTVGMYADVFLHMSGSDQQSSARRPIKRAQSEPPPQEEEERLLREQENEQEEARALLHAFVLSSLALLSRLLDHVLPSLISTSALSSVLTQLAYCAHAFARHGCDFAQLARLKDRVEAQVLAIVRAHWLAARHDWARTWRKACKGSPSSSSTAAAAGGAAAHEDSSPLMQRSRSATNTGGGGGGPTTRQGVHALAHDFLLASSASASSSSSSSASSTSSPAQLLLVNPVPASSSSSSFHHQPASIMALLPPLARYVNAHADALNALRLLPATALAEPLSSAQADELHALADALGAYVDEELALWRRGRSVQDSDEAQERADDDDEDEEEEEERAARLAHRHARDESRRVLVMALRLVSRTAIPWLRAALIEGVYGGASTTGGLSTRPRGGEDRAVAVSKGDKVTAACEKLESYADELESRTVPL